MRPSIVIGIITSWPKERALRWREKETLLRFILAICEFLMVTALNIDLTEFDLVRN